MFKKVLFLILVLFFCGKFCFAGDLAKNEAVNYFNDGVKAQQEADYDKAEMNYQKTLLVDPFNTEWQKAITNNRGIIYARIGDLKSAEAAFNAALKIDPNYKPALLNLGFIYEVTRSKLESLQYWMKILNVDIELLKPKSFIIGEEEQVQEKK